MNLSRKLAFTFQGVGVGYIAWEGDWVAAWQFLLLPVKTFEPFLFPPLSFRNFLMHEA